jgi:hypothetical protein
MIIKFCILTVNIETVRLHVVPVLNTCTNKLIPVILSFPFVVSCLWLLPGCFTAVLNISINHLLTNMIKLATINYYCNCMMTVVLVFQ